MNVIYLALCDSAENLKACFRLDECGIDDASDILHSLQTVVKKHILSLPSVENLDKKIKKVSTYAAHSTKFTAELKNQQKLLDPECTPLVLEQDCPTRWNIKFYIFKCMLRLKRALMNTMMEVQSWASYKNSIIYDVEITHRDWQLMEQVIEVLEPFEQATRMLSSSQACISSVIPVITTIINGLEEICSGNEKGVKTMAKNLKNGMEAKFKFIETDKKYIMTTALDPRFKTSFFRFNETTSIIKNAKNYLKNLWMMISFLLLDQVRYSLI